MRPAEADPGGAPVTISKNSASNPVPQPKPVNVTAKAQSSGDPNSIIDRKMVAGAFDRPGDDGTAPDGIISDPELQQIHSQVQSLLYGYGGDEDKARRLYSGLQHLSRIDVPTSPRARMGGLDDSVNSAKTALNDHFKILQQVPVERARDVVSREVIRLKSPTTPAKLTSSLVGAAAAGGGLFAAVAGGALALAGGPLIAAIGGAAVVGLGLGWFVGKLINDSGAKNVEADLKVLETISPEKNKQELNQYAAQAYKLLQDARTVTTLARLRAYDEDASGVQRSVDGATNKIRSQAASLRDIQKLVDKYSSK
jgi:hypothetical protein